jgi:chromosome partitioning protein
VILVVGNTKGGVGKSTIATNLAVIRAQTGKDVLLVDADTQQSTVEFANLRSLYRREPEVTTTALHGLGVVSEIKRLKPKYDDIVIDVGGRDTAALRSAAMVADLLLVPVLPSQFDTWAAEKIGPILLDAKGMNPDLKVLVVLNQADTHPRATLADETQAAIEELGYKVADTRLHYRVAYRRSVADGLAVNELSGKRDNSAIVEISGLYMEVFDGYA